MSLPPVFSIKITYTHYTYPTDLTPIRSTFDAEFLGSSVFGMNIYDAWCADLHVPLDLSNIGSGHYSATLKASVYSIYENVDTFNSIFPNPQNWGNLDEIDWLIRQNFSASGYTFGEVQAAVWQLMGDAWQGTTIIGTTDPAKVDDLVNQAHLHDGYAPVIDITDNDPTNDNISVLLATFKDNNNNGVKDAGDTVQQPIIIQVKSAAIGDRVWHDVDADGVQDAGENGIAGALVHLVRDSNNDGDFLDAGEVLQTTVTNASGDYVFTGLAPGADYQVRFFTPSGYDATSPRQADGSSTSGSNSDGLLSDVIVLAAGEYNKTIDSGFYKHVSVGNYVWNDINTDGVQNDGATGISGVTLTLTGNTGSGLPVVLTTTTAPDGSYLFANLVPGTYQVTVDASNFAPGGVLVGFVASPILQGGDTALDSNASPSGTTPILLPSDTDDFTLDFGYNKSPESAKISGYVYEDFDNDGMKDGGEPGIGNVMPGAGVLITLTGTDDLGASVTLTTTTDATGYYEFTNLRPGTYTATETQPGAYLDGQDTAGSAGGSTAINDVISGIVLTSGANSINNNFGELVGAQIHGFVYGDNNNDGIKDGGEPGIGGVIVTLSGTNDLGSPVSASTTTAPDGSYSFTGLRPGTYSVTEFTQPVGYLDGKDTAGTPGGGAAGNEVISNITLTQGLISYNNNFGEILPATLSGYVYEDFDNDGMKEGGEPGIGNVMPGAGVLITLTGTDDLGAPVTLTTTTDATGYYEFTNLRPGTYTATETQPGAYLDGKDTAGSAGGSTAINDVISGIVLTSGANSINNNFGELVGAQIHGFVYGDNNDDGIKDGGEPGIGGVIVILSGTNDLGSPVSASTTTAPDGSYSFTGLRPGTYSVTETQPGGYIDGKDTAGTPGGGNAVVNDIISNITLTQGLISYNNNFGELNSTSIGDRVWIDANTNGVQDNGELGKSGVTVELYTCVNNSPGVLMGSQTTDANGNYSFTDLVPGDYIVKFITADGYTLTTANVGVDSTDSDASVGGFTGCYTLASGETNNTIDAGFIPPVTHIDIKKYTNGQDADLTTGPIIAVGDIATFTYEIKNTGVDPLTNVVVTDNAGTPGVPGDDFQAAPVLAGFVQMISGLGSIRFPSLSGSQSNGLGFDLNISGPASFDENDIQSVSWTLDPTTYQITSLNLVLQHDTNQVGVDYPSSRVDLTLTSIGIGQIQGSGGDVSHLLDVDGNPYAIGGAFFIPPRAVTPSGTGFNVGDQDKDNLLDVNETWLYQGSRTVTAGQYTNDALVTGSGAFSGTPVQDADPSNHFGLLPAALGNYVWLDKNANGLQDSDEAGINGVSVRLLKDTDNDGTPDTVVLTQITGDDPTTPGIQQGYYKFSGLLPDVAYQVQFVSPDTVGPDAYSLTPQDQGINDTIDSDANVTTGLSQAVVLTPGQYNDTVDAGFYQKASIGDRVWFDDNTNGVQDNGEVGKSGVTVELYTCVNNVPGVLMGSQITDANGNYSFTDLIPGNYIVRFIAVDGSVLTTANIGDDAFDSDAGIGGFTGCYNLESGEHETSVDAGFYQKASIGDRVWIDTNTNGVQDNGELGKSGVTVELYTCVNNAAGVLMGSQTTDANGNYSFTDLMPGNYIVRFIAVDGSVLTTANIGDDAFDSDAGIGGFTGCYNLESGEHETSVDAGFYKTNIDIDVEKYVSVDGGQSWHDADTVTGPYLNSGTAPQFMFEVTNTGNVALTNVDVIDDVFGTIFLDGILDVGLGVSFIKTDATWTPGQHTNTVTATGDFTDGNGNTFTDSDSDKANYFGSNAEIDVEKYVSVDGGVSWQDADTVTGPYLNSGTTPQFKFVVTNTGNVALTNVDVVDDVYGTITLDGTLDVGATATFFKTGTWALGQHTNTATATGDFTDSNGNTETDSDSDKANYFGSDAEIDVEKYVSIDGGLNWVDADTVTGPYLNSGIAPQFKFVVTNTGNVALTNVDVVDDVYGTITMDGTLDVGASATFYKTGTWEAGQHTNTATATGDFTDGNGNTETDSDSDKANYFGSDAEIDVEKYVSIDGGLSWLDADTATGPYLNSGIAPQFKFVVTNTGNVALTNVDVVDDVYGTITMDGTLDVGASATFFKTGTWSEGQHTNTATATGDFTDGNGNTETDSDSDKANYFGSDAEIDVEKYVSIDGGLSWQDADTVTGPYLNSGTAPQFKFVVTNTGNVALTNVDVVDDVYGTITMDGTLDVGASATFFKTGTWAAGQHTNTATATGDFTDGNGNTETDSDSDKANYFGSDAEIDVEKYVSIDGGLSWQDADTVTGPYLNSGIAPQFKFVVTNTGNVALTNVDVVDDVYGTITMDGTLDVGASATFYKTGVWEAGQHTNTATATGDFTDGNGNTETDSDSDKANYFGTKVSIDVEKYVSGTTCTTVQNNCGEGASVSYWKNNCVWDSCQNSYGWKDTGCKATDTYNSVFGVDCTGGTRTLQQVLNSTSTTSQDVLMRESVAAYLNACHTKVDYTYSKEEVCAQTKYAVERGDYDQTCKSFNYENNQGCDWTSSKTTWNCTVDTVLYDADSKPGLEVKTGSTVTFTYVVKNTGDNALKNVTLVDDRIANITYLGGDTDKDGLLDTTETWTYKATEVAQAGTIKNIGTVTAVDAVGGVTQVSDADPAYYTGSGLVNKSSLGDRVWCDSNANGIQETGESGIAGVTMKLAGAGVDGLFGTADDITATTTTNTSGYYQFSGLDAGKYQVSMLTPTGYTVTKQDQGTNDAQDSDFSSTGVSQIVTLGAGEQNLTVDAGLYKTPKVSIDVEKYVSGTTCTTVQNNCGEGASVSYWKNNCVWDSSQNSYGWKDTGCKATDTYNSVFGVNCTGGTRTLQQVLNSTSTTSQDVLMRESVAAYLNACHTKVDYTYSKEEVCAQTKYAVERGDYDQTCKSFNYENNQGCDWTSSKTTWNCTVETVLYDADSKPGLEVKTGSTVTFTYVVKNTGDNALKNVTLVDDRIANITYLGGDTDKDGLLDTTETWTYKATEVAQAGTIKNIGTVTAVDAVGGVTQVSDADPAYYTGSGLVNKSSLGDRVWCDSNANGIQETGESGIAGVTMKLAGAGVDGLFGTADDITATTTTNTSGYYQFSGLDAGKYQVSMLTPTGYAVTKQDQGTDDAKDSDINSSGVSQIVTLGAGEQNLTVDAGLNKVSSKCSVGNLVWEDKDHDNIQDAGECGIGGIKVTLLNGSGVIVATTTTNTSGNYSFTNLDAGTYQLRFDKTNVSYAGYNMSNWMWAKKDQGTNDSIDSDVAGDAVSKTNVTLTSQFTLVSGQNDMTRDAGITPIVIDLNGDGIHTISRNDSAGSFDLLGTGTAIQSGWLSGGDGFLAVDKDGNGRIDNISELFGGNSKGDGFARLASYDSNRDGVVDTSDADFSSLKVWQDANGNHQTDAGELVSLDQAGVASLQVSYVELPFLDASGNLHLERSNATLADGTVVDMTDVYFNVSATDAAAAGVTLPTMGDLMSNNTSLDSLFANLSGSESMTKSQIDNGMIMDSTALDAMKQMAHMYEQMAISA